MRKALIASLIAVYSLFSPLYSVRAQCPPTIILSTSSAEITIDDFGDISAGVTRNGILNVGIDAAAGCIWDLYTTATLTQNVQYSPNGDPLTLSAIEISAFNFCRTPDHDYLVGLPPPPPRISGTLDAAFIGGDNYIVGTALGVALIPKIGGPCVGTNINGVGTAAGSPTTHTFRIDIRVTPGVTPVVEPGLYNLALDFTTFDDATSITNITTFNLQIEILPVLQLKMTTSDQVDFIFTDIGDYAAGITKYGATVLSVSSSLDWDLMAVGTSTLNESTGGASAFWDQNLSYSTVGTANIPLGVLELHQIPSNPLASGVGVDYSPAFTTPPSGNNYIEVGSGSGVAIAFTSAPGPPANKTIAGNWGDIVGGGGVSSMRPGSYLSPIIGGGVVGDYRYTMSYRITPGLPVTFNGLMGDAQPGYYTMQIRYLLSEDQ